MLVTLFTAVIAPFIVGVLLLLVSRWLDKNDNSK
ncbi:type I toxin-antitoxin system Fst family toxin (plasmid) [Lactococcus lactis]|uniref:Type I toxin-antitoxin system Fst family toxin n=2 Tax=Lactococcus TaxID=1357 RepID=T0VID1_LACLC|nr:MULTISPECIES: type I toxin-antitoxin system Fst family toxin [Lactococcus]EQC86607.1 hypothetical protein LLT7_02895 [Lactococcus cremoris subsp. cremoris TIFN7]EQC92032.1 hypothetical protein LLT3_16150 [Lactococcus cremoris subsp. cremoris TIFN3]MDN5611551.1 type I toxin-antitoxin system Fst family toxin [Staphylococcus equorum]MDN6196172.1 type I toxin-antitoxin system Fst family toxin [Atopostipes suicloacalis]MDN6244844.1 type I toxin-antitoxin system Fst family toxin [Tetragenococcus 